MTTSRCSDDRNPFDFKHVDTEKCEYQDHGPCIVMCSPGTMVSVCAVPATPACFCSALSRQRIVYTGVDEWDVAGAV